MAKYIWAPLETLTDPELTDSERKVLQALYSFLDDGLDYVWPRAETLGDRCRIRDTARLSKLTSSLVAKGWVTKKRMGYTGLVRYRLHVPSRLTGDDLFHDEPVLAESTKTHLAESTKTDSPVLAESTKMYLAESTKNKELTTELTNYSLSHVKNVIPLGRERAGRAHLESRGSTLRESGWCVGESQRRALEYLRPDLLHAVDFLEDNFRDLHKSSGKCSLDWDAEWQIFLRREKSDFSHLVGG